MTKAPPPSCKEPGPSDKQRVRFFRQPVSSFNQAVPSLKQPVPDIDPDYLLKTQLSILFSNIRFIILGNFVTGALVLYLLWDVVPGAILLAWGIGILFISAYRYLVERYYRGNPDRLYLCRRLYLVGSLISGFAWGSLGLFDLPLVNSYMVAVILCGLITNAMASSLVLLPAVHFFALPAAIPMTVVNLAKGGDWLFLSVVSSLYILTIAGYSLVLHKYILSGIALRKDNLELIKKLSAQTAELADAKETAERANVAKSKFLATASHDLRQPLHALGLFISALKFTQEKSEREMIQAKLEATQHSISELFDALLDLSKMDADAIEIQIQPVPIRDILSRLASEFSAMAQEKNIELRWRAADLWVTSDPLWLERILRNLLSNAVRYTQSGGVLLALRVHRDQAIIQVWDTGIGIPAESLDEVFGEFTQLNAGGTDGRLGLGLGLSVVKRLVSRLGHDLQVASVAGRGSVFSLRLEVAQAPAQESVELASFGHQNLLEGKQVLVVDDEPEVLQAMQIMLEKWGCQVWLADSIKTALAFIDERGSLPDLIVTDYQLEEEATGLDLLDQIEECWASKVPSLVVTGDTSAEKVRMFKNAGVRVLHKPVQQAKIRMMLNHLCQ